MKTTITIRYKEYDSANAIKERYGITYLTLLSWTRRGVLPEPIRIAKRVYYDRSGPTARCEWPTNSGAAA
jgi:hypothetical protein